MTDSNIPKRGQTVLNLPDLSKMDFIPYEVFETPMEAWDAIRAKNLWPSQSWMPGAKVHGNGFVAVVISRFGEKYFTGPFYLHENGVIR